MAINKTTAKISQTEISGNQVQGQTNPLKGNISENQAVFDRLPKKIAAKFNNFVDTVAGEFENVGVPLDEHENNKANPHQVTARQVGAYTQKETDDALDALSDTLQTAVGEKVDKEAGKGLSSNDFTDDYKTKLDNLDETIGSEVERISEDVDNLSDEVLEHKSDKANPHQLTASQVGAYTKTEVDARLSYKANKSDIVNAYRFCGSVDTFDDLPFAYKLIPNGVPTKNGEVCGVYAPYEEDGVVLQRVCEINTTLNYGDLVIIPIVPITIKAGTYMPHTVINFGNALAAEIGLYNTMSGAFDTFESEQTIDHIEVYYPYSTDEPANYPLVIEPTDNFGVLKNVADSWFDLYNGWRIPEGAYDNGAVYNVLDTGMNYAWNGTEWDALGGEHRDIEAHHRLDILGEQKADKSEVNTEIGKKADKLYVDESLGQITEKINRKADEDAVYPKAETYTQTEVDNKLNNKANKSDVYTKTEINSRLIGYLTKQDIVNAYRFCGSVSTFDELPFDYALIPNGAPTKNGEVCGEYVEDMGDYVHFGINTTLNYGDEVLIPIKPITLKAGTYYGNINESYLGGITIESIFGNDLSVSIGDFHNMLTAYQEIEEQTVEYIKVTFPYNTEEPANYPFYVEHINTGLGALKKLADGWLDEWYGWRIPNGAYDNGAVYNVLDTGMNYAWNGTEYDALGGEHQDLEARADIENLETQVGDIGTALDEIIEIQNTLTGGESE